MEGGGEDVGASRLNPKNILSNGRQGKGGEKGESEAKQSKLSSPCRPSPPSCRNLNPFFAPQLFPPLLFYAEAERTSSLPGFGFWQCRPRAVSVSVSRQAKILFPHSRVGRERGVEIFSSQLDLLRPRIQAFVHAAFYSTRSSSSRMIFLRSSGSDAPDSD